jgi:hypothetical protein
VQVLEHKQQRPPGTEPAQQPEDQLEQLGYLDPIGGPGGPSRVELGQQTAQAAPGRAEHVGQLCPRRGAGQRAQRVDERGERQAFRAELYAVAGQDREPRVGRVPGQLRDQAGLAHTSLARNDREPRLAVGGSPQQRGQRLDLPTPPDRRPDRIGLLIPRARCHNRRGRGEPGTG